MTTEKRGKNITIARTKCQKTSAREKEQKKLNVIILLSLWHRKTDIYMKKMNLNHVMISQYKFYAPTDR